MHCTMFGRMKHQRFNRHPFMSSRDRLVGSIGNLRYIVRELTSKTVTLESAMV